MAQWVQQQQAQAVAQAQLPVSLTLQHAVGSPSGELSADPASNKLAVEEASLKATGPMNIRERYKEVFDLQRQGKSMDYIAKKMSMNKGELQLILQLAKQEESLHA
jgi:DNA-binding NarL/FixJ family response regulator